MQRQREQQVQRSTVEGIMHGGKPEAGPHIQCSDTKHPPQEFSGRDEREGAKCPHKATYTNESVRQPAKCINPALSDRMHGAGNGGLGGSFGQCVCVPIAV